MPHFTYEINAGYPQVQVLGVDEVGRGCIAGPVVAAAVLLPTRWSDSVAQGCLPKELQGMNDSKKLTAAQREKFAGVIEQLCPLNAVGQASVEEIDRWNIFQASHLAMLRAVQGVIRLMQGAQISTQSLHVLVDGKFLPRQQEWVYPATPIIQGDAQSVSIAAASIIAKVYRDRFLQQLEEVYPGYGLAQNKGYPTAAHSTALKAKGITPIHRKSFRPVQEAALGVFPA
jgi:ribonuclease HII